MTALKSRYMLTDFAEISNAKEGCIFGGCRQGICFVPVILVLSGIMGLNGVLYAQPVADVLAAVITGAREILSKI